MSDPREHAAQHKRREQKETLGVGGHPGFKIVLDRQLHCETNPFAPTGKGTVSPPALKSCKPYNDACSKSLSKSWKGTVDTLVGLYTQRHQLGLQNLG